MKNKDYNQLIIYKNHKVIFFNLSLIVSQVKMVMLLMILVLEYTAGVQDSSRSRKLFMFMIAHL